MDDTKRCVSCGGIVKTMDCPECKLLHGPGETFNEKECHACGYMQPDNDP